MTSITPMTRFDDRVPGLLLGRRYRLLRHVVLQAVVAAITATMLWDEPDAILGERFVAWGLYFLQVDIVVYGNMLVLVPRLLARGRTGWYFPALLGLILVSILTVGLLQPPSDNPALGDAGSVPPLAATLSSLFAFYFFVLGLTAVQLLKFRLENVRRLEGLRNATMRVELENLRNQINPHFLFNMLNNANIVAGEDTDRAAYILSKLRELLRYQIDAGSERTIRLADDAAFLDDYLALEKLRRDRLEYDIRVEGSMDVEVPPLLFIPFVENAVKHNPGNDSYVRILFAVGRDRLRFECENPKPRRGRETNTGGIGLVNVRRRLDLLYGDDYSLELTDGDEVYKVTMEIKL